MKILNMLPASVQRHAVSEIALGSYQLLLGAGASLDSLDANGENLPRGNELALQLRRDFNLSESADLPLSYERAVRKSSERGVFDYLKGRYTRCTPAAWYRDFVDIMWSRVWTLNIDDVVERAYEAYRDVAHQDTESYSWDSLFEEIDKLQIVHLHGSLGSTSSKRLVFSVVEYLDAREEEHAWHRIFGESWAGGRPFIAMGATLNTEYDLARIFRSKKNSSTLPSFYVAPGIKPDTAQDLHAWNIIPIEATAGAFISELAEEVRHIRSTPGRVWSRSQAPKHVVASFANSFRHLGKDGDDLVAEDHDFLKGDPPTWVDILGNKDAVFQWEEKISRCIDEDFASGEAVARVHAMISDRFSGRSTGILRIALAQHENGRDVYLFRGERRLDIPGVVTFLKSAPNSVLLFDGAADFADNIRDLVQTCTEQSVNCVIVLFERTERRKRIVAELSVEGVLLHDELEVSSLKNTDAERLVRHLRTQGRTHRIADWSFRKQVRHFEDNGLFSGLAQVEYGHGFRHRMSTEVEIVDDDLILRLVFLTSALDTFGYGLPLDYAFAVGASSADAKERLTSNSSAKPLLVLRDGSVYARHRRITLDPALRKIGHEKAGECLKDLAIGLKDYAGMVRQRPLPYRILAGIMRARPLEHWVGARDLAHWYDALQGDFGGNARFWEQRAIAEQILGRWGSAESFAKYATILAPSDAHRFNTLGSILLQRAAVDKTLNPEEIQDVYGRGRRALEKSAMIDRGNPVPIWTFLKQSLPLLTRLTDEGGSALNLVNDWQQWLTDARYHPGFRHGEESKQLDTLHRSFLHMNISITH